LNIKLVKPHSSGIGNFSLAAAVAMDMTAMANRAESFIFSGKEDDLMNTGNRRRALYTSTNCISPIKGSRSRWIV
jgi:hypothetical protein